MSDPAYLHTVTLDELMDNVFQGKSAVIENLLYTGAYILAGAPKIGKSFLVAQIAHHVSTGQDLWGYKAHQGTVLYLALENDESRLQRRMFRMFGVEGTSSVWYSFWHNKAPRLLVSISYCLTNGVQFTMGASRFIFCTIDLWDLSQSENIS